MHIPQSFRTSTLVLCAIAMAAGCQSAKLPRATATTSTISDKLEWSVLTIGPGDILRVIVLNHPELSTPHETPAGTRVDDQGLLSLPLVGDVPVGDKLLVDVRRAIREAYAKYVKDPSVDVSVLEYGARKVFLFGEVEHPGAFVMDRPLDVYQALALGGGFTSRAWRDKVVLLRGRADSLEVEVIDAEHPDVHSMIAVRPDDMLFVRRTGAGKFSEEFLPILTGISSSLSSIATLILIDDRLR